MTRLNQNTAPPVPPPLEHRGHRRLFAMKAGNAADLWYPSITGTVPAADPAGPLSERDFRHLGPPNLPVLFLDRQREKELI